LIYSIERIQGAGSVFFLKCSLPSRNKYSPVIALITASPPEVPGKYAAINALLVFKVSSINIGLPANSTETIGIYESFAFTALSIAAQNGRASGRRVRMVSA